MGVKAELVKGVAEAAKNAKRYLYHGTAEGVDFKPIEYDFLKSDTGVGSNVINQGNYFYTTEGEGAAKWFADQANQSKQMREGVFPPKLRGGNVMRLIPAEDANIKYIEDMPLADENASKALIESARDDGYDAVEFIDKGLETVEGSRGIYDDVQRLGHMPKTTIILNPSKFDRGNADQRLLAAIGLGGAGASMLGGNEYAGNTSAFDTPINDYIRTRNERRAGARQLQYERMAANQEQTIEAPQGALRQASGFAGEQLGELNRRLEGHPAYFFAPTGMEEFLNKYAYGEASPLDAAMGAFDLGLLTAPKAMAKTLNKSGM